ncbi:MAG TPA: hypothetical protein VLU43_06815 [Anaeromyxobacteraceae bacterium]|nr:hypothetical protein [Anaeromyxobacteraceae bacterium]
MSRPALAALAALALLLPPARAADPHPPADAILLTIFLRHDQSMPLGEINARLEKNGWYQRFPPAGTEVVSWYVMMGIGQVVTLRVPPDKLREVNLAVENGAWGGYRTEFYATYDFKAVWDQEQAKRRK